MLALALSLIILAVPLAPLGLQSIVVRHRLPATPRLLLRGLLGGLTCALIVAAAGRLVYGLAYIHLTMIGLAVVGGGVAHLAAAVFASQERYPLAVAFSQGANYFLLVGSVIAGLGLAGIGMPLAVLALGFAIAAAWGWQKLLREGGHALACKQQYHWPEALLLTGTATAAQLLAQLERLVIPKVLTIEELAVFSVLASVVISPFRLLRVAVTGTLVPGLRNAATVRARRHQFVQEAAIVHAILLVACVAIWFLLPLVSDLLLEGKYQFPTALVLAAFASGWMRVLSGFANAAVTALGSTQQLAAWSLCSWLLLGLSAIGAVAGARWGLAGVIYGAMFGWAGSVAVAGSMVLPYFQERPPAPLS